MSLYHCVVTVRYSPLNHSTHSDPLFSTNVDVTQTANKVRALHSPLEFARAFFSPCKLSISVATGGHLSILQSPR